MTNPFRDQEKFMKACDQTVGELNQAQYKLYLDLMDEEWRELKSALLMDNRVEQLDALLDFIVVTIGAIHSGGFEGEGAWKEVMSTNLAKVDTEERNALLGHGSGSAEEGSVSTEREEHFAAWESRRDTFALLGCEPPVLDAARGAPTCRLVPRIQGEVVGWVVDKSVAAHSRIIAYGHTRVAYRTRAS